MLTKDLIRTRTYKGELKPQFIDTSNPSLIELATELLALYDPSMKLSRTEIESGVMGVVNSARDIKLAKGINKLILDRTEFSTGGDFDHRSFRQEIFTYTTELLKAGRPVEEYLSLVREKFGDRIDQLDDIYGDHPECEQLVSIKPISPHNLLERYNVSLVQSLLLQSNSLEITLQEPDSAKLRRLFNYLKFFRLLADVRYSTNYKSRLHLTVAGPGSVLENVNKYGLQIASFFPALVQMSRWSMVASVKYNKKELNLTLDQKSGLVSHYNRIGVFVPEEISLFQKQFQKKKSEWKISDRAPFVKLDDGSLLFPDMFFRHSSGKIIALELFHRWHSTPLLTRLTNAEQFKSSDVIIGVDRSVAKKPHIKEELASSEFYQTNGFQFNDFPAITIVLKLLDTLL